MMDEAKILELARQAGLRVLGRLHPIVISEQTDGVCTDDLLAFARLVAAAERAECAKVCEAVNAEHCECPELAIYCADAIRARG